MKANRIPVAMVLVLWGSAGCAGPSLLPAGRWVDLTYDYSEQTVYWPTAQGFKLENEFAGTTEKGYYYP